MLPAIAGTIYKHLRLSTGVGLAFAIALLAMQGRHVTLRHLNRERRSP
jgi:hypothetical protein